MPALPRTSSATSGLSFWGIIDDPVDALSGSVMNPNSEVDQMTISSPIRDRCCDQHRGRVEVVEGEVAVGDRVDRVPHLALGRVEPEGRARERARTEAARRGRVARRGEPRAVAVEHLDPGEQVVPEVTG